MSTTFHYKSQLMFARKIDRRCYIGSIARNYRIRARRRYPCIEPARCFCTGRLIGHPEWVSHILPGLKTGGTFCVGAASSEERLHFDQVSTDCVLQLLPERRLRPSGVRRPHATNEGLRCRRCAQWPTMQEDNLDNARCYSSQKIPSSHIFI